MVPPAPPEPPSPPPLPSTPPVPPPPPLWPGGYLVVLTEADLRGALLKASGSAFLFLPSGVTFDLAEPIVVDGRTVELLSEGGGATLRAANRTRLLVARNRANVTLRYISLHGGRAADDDGGGAVLASDGSRVMMSHGVVRNSTAPLGPGGGMAASRWSSLTLQLAWRVRAACR